MKTTREDALYVECCVENGPTDPNWTELGNTTVPYLPKEYVLDPSRTTNEQVAIVLDDGDVIIDGSKVTATLMDNSFVDTELTNVHYLDIQNAESSIFRTIDGDAVAGSGYGEGVRISYDALHMVVGESKYTSTTTGNVGRVLVYTRSTTSEQWVLETVLEPTTPSTGLEFGKAVAMSGDGLLLAVSNNDSLNTGNVVLYERATLLDAWAIQTTQNVGSVNPGSLALNRDGNTLAVGIKSISTVKVYRRPDNATPFDFPITSSSPGNDDTGADVALDATGELLAVGIPRGTVLDGGGSSVVAGRVDIRKLSGGSYGDIAQLKAEVPVQYMEYGTSVSFNQNGSLVAVGITGYDDTETNQGRVALYRANAAVDAWVIKEYSDTPLPNQDGVYGIATSLSGDGSILVTAAVETTGVIYTIQLEANTSTILVDSDTMTVTDTTHGDGISITEDGLSMLAGIAGTAEVALYTRSNIYEGWTLSGTMVNPNGITPNDYFGMQVAISGDGLSAAIGSINDDSGNSWGAIHHYTRADLTSAFTFVETTNDVFTTYAIGLGLSLSDNGLILAVVDGSASIRSYHRATTGDSWTASSTYTVLDSVGNDKSVISVAINSDGTLFVVGTDDNSVHTYTRILPTDDLSEITVNAQGTHVVNFGSDLALSSSGTHLAVLGMTTSISGGRIYLYEFDNSLGVWQLQTVNNDQYGNTTAAFKDIGITLGLDGKVMVTGNSDSPAISTYLLTWAGIAVKEIMIPTNTMFTENTNPDGGEYGRSIAISSDGLTLAIGAPIDSVGGNPDGSIYVYKRITTTDPWSYHSKVDKPNNAHVSPFGRSIAINSDGTIILATEDTDTFVNTFDLTGTTWADSVGYGSTPTITGVQLSPDGLNMYILDFEGTGASYTGTVRTFERANITSGWTDSNIDLDLSGLVIPEDEFADLAISNNQLLLAVGISQPVNAGNPSAQSRVLTFSRTAIGAAWSVNPDATIIGPSDGSVTAFGDAVAFNDDGSVLAIGAILTDTQLDDVGSVYLYRNSIGGWAAKRQITPNNPSMGMLFGSAVALRGDTSGELYIGAPLSNLDGPDSGYVNQYTYDISDTVPSFTEVSSVSVALADMSNRFFFISDDGLTMFVYSGKNTSGPFEVRVRPSIFAEWVVAFTRTYDRGNQVFGTMAGDGNSMIFPHYNYDSDFRYYAKVNDAWVEGILTIENFSTGFNTDRTRPHMTTDGLGLYIPVANSNSTISIKYYTRAAIVDDFDFVSENILITDSVIDTQTSVVTIMHLSADETMGVLRVKFQGDSTHGDLLAVTFNRDTTVNTWAVINSDTANIDDAPYTPIGMALSDDGMQLMMVGEYQGITDNVQYGDYINIFSRVSNVSPWEYVETTNSLYVSANDRDASTSVGEVVMSASFNTLMIGQRNVNDRGLYYDSVYANSGNGPVYITASGLNTTFGKIPISDPDNSLTYPKPTGALLSLEPQLSLSGDGLTLAVGLPNYDSKNGRVYIYERTALTTEWALIEAIDFPTSVTASMFGYPVLNYDGRSLLVGAPYHHESTDVDHGAVHTFYRANKGIAFTYVGRSQSTTPAESRIGESLDMGLGGLFTVAGAPGHKQASSNIGGVYLNYRSSVSDLSNPGGSSVSLAPVNGIDGNGFGTFLAVSEDGLILIIMDLNRTTSVNHMYYFSRPDADVATSFVLQQTIDGQTLPGYMFNGKPVLSLDKQTIVVCMSNATTDELYKFTYNSGTDEYDYVGLVSTTAPYSATNAFLTGYTEADDAGVSMIGWEDPTVSEIVVESYAMQTPEVGLVEALPTNMVDPYDVFGSAMAISLDGLYMLVGSINGGNNNSGIVKCFSRADKLSTWTAETNLIDANSIAGDNFGRGIGISDDGLTAVVGSSGFIVGSSQVGKITVFTRATRSASWVTGATIDATILNANVYFGDALALSGDALTLVVGEDTGVHTFKRTSTSNAFTLASSFTVPVRATKMTIDRTGSLLVLTTADDRLITYTYAGDVNGWISMGNAVVWPTTLGGVAMSGNGQKLLVAGTNSDATTTPKDIYEYAVGELAGVWVFSEVLTLEHALPLTITYGDVLTMNGDGDVIAIADNYDEPNARVYTYLDLVVKSSVKQVTHLAIGDLASGPATSNVQHLFATASLGLHVATDPVTKDNVKPIERTYIAIDASTPANGSSIVAIDPIYSGEELTINFVTAKIGNVSVNGGFYVATLPNHGLTSAVRYAFRTDKTVFEYVNSTNDEYVGTNPASGILDIGDAVMLDNATEVAVTSLTETSELGEFTGTYDDLVTRSNLGEYISPRYVNMQDVYLAPDAGGQAAVRQGVDLSEDGLVMVTSSENANVIVNGGVSEYYGTVKTFKRASIKDSWKLVGIPYETYNSPIKEQYMGGHVSISGDALQMALTVVKAIYRTGEVYIFTRASIELGWTYKQKLGVECYATSMSADGLTITGDIPNTKMYTRTSVSGTFNLAGPIVNNIPTDHIVDGDNIAMSKDGLVFVIFAELADSNPRVEGRYLLYARTSTDVTTWDYIGKTHETTPLLLSDVTEGVALSYNGNTMLFSTINGIERMDRLYKGDSFTDNGYIISPDFATGENYGAQVAISRNHAMVTSRTSSTFNAVDIFIISEFYGQYDDAGIVPNLSGTSTFGQAIVMDPTGTHMAISDPEAGSGYGTVYILARPDTNSDWVQTASFQSVSLKNGMRYGHSLAMGKGGLLLVVGAPMRNGGGDTAKGYVEVLVRDSLSSTTWTLAYSIVGPAAEAMFGGSVAYSEKLEQLFVAYTTGTGLNPVIKQGRVLVYDVSSGSPVQDNIIDGGAYAGDGDHLGLALVVQPTTGFIGMFRITDPSLASYPEVCISTTGETPSDVLAPRTLKTSGTLLALSEDGTEGLFGVPTADVTGTNDGVVSIMRIPRGDGTHASTTTTQRTGPTSYVDIFPYAKNTGNGYGRSVAMNRDGSYFVVSDEAGMLYTYKRAVGARLNTTRTEQLADGTPTTTNNRPLAVTEDGLTTVYIYNGLHINTKEHVYGPVVSTDLIAVPNGKYMYSGDISGDGSVVVTLPFIQDFNTDDATTWIFFYTYDNQTNSWTKQGQQVLATDYVPYASTSGNVGGMLSYDGLSLAISLTGTKVQEIKTLIYKRSDVSSTFTLVDTKTTAQYTGSSRGSESTYSGDGLTLAITTAYNKVTIYNRAGINNTFHPVQVLKSGVTLFVLDYYAMPFTLTHDGLMLAISENTSAGTQITMYTRPDNRGKFVQSINLDKSFIPGDWSPLAFFQNGNKLITGDSGGVVTPVAVIVDIKTTYDVSELEVIFRADTVGPTISNGDNLGDTVAVSGNGLVVAIGAPNRNGTGEVHTYVRADRSSPWTYVNVTTSPSAGVGYRFGDGVALNYDGTCMLVSEPEYNPNNDVRAPGHVISYIRTNVNAVWVQDDTLSSSGASYSVGYAVGISDDGLNAFFKNDNAVRIYNRAATSNTWTGIASTFDYDEVTNMAMSGDGKWFAVLNAIGSIDIRYREDVAEVGAELPIVNIVSDPAPVAGYEFGKDIALNHDATVMIVGCRSPLTYNLEQGVVKMFVRNIGEASFMYLGHITPSNQYNEGYGTGVSISADANTILVGSPLSDITATDGGKFETIELARAITPLNEILGYTRYPTETNYKLGKALSLSSDAMHVAMSRTSNRVDIYERSAIGSQWIANGEVTGVYGTSTATFGNAIDMTPDGLILVVGEDQSDIGTGVGVVHTFSRPNVGSTTWTAGTRIDGTLENTGSGVAVSADGLVLTVSAISAVETYVRTATGDSWALALTTSLPSEELAAISSIDIDDSGLMMVVGVDKSVESGFAAGALYTYSRANIYAAWALDNITYEENLTGSLEYGSSVSLSSDGMGLLVGAPGYAGESGIVFYYDRPTVNDPWTKLGINIEQSPYTGSRFGRSVAMAEDMTNHLVGTKRVEGSPNVDDGRVYTYVLSGSGLATYTIGFATQPSAPLSCEITNSYHELARNNVSYDGIKFTATFDGALVDAHTVCRAYSIEGEGTDLMIPITTTVI